MENTIGFNWSSSIKRRRRRTGAEMDGLLDSILGILEGEEGQITLRHLFYRLVGLGAIPKAEQAYRSLGHHVAKWRRLGAIEWSAFADHTRWHIRQPTFAGVDEALQRTAETYRRDLWASQKVYVEVWCEKDSVAGILAKAAEPFGVPVFVARGFASLSSLHSAAETFRRAVHARQRPVIHHFGDFDPSGVAAGQAMLRTFKDDFKIEIEFSRAAVTQEQIRALSLPTRPVKHSDSRAAKWGGHGCVELDSMLPADIRKLVEGCITGHIDRGEWERLQEIEQAEKQTLQLVRRWLQ